MNAILRRQHLSRHLHRLGARAVDELLAELGSAHGISDDILARLERYGQLDPRVLRQLGADGLPPAIFGVAS